MSHARFTVPAAGLVAFLLPAAAERVAFAPAEDATAVKEFEVSVTFSIDDFAVRADGAEVTVQIDEHTPDEIEGDAEYSLRVEDRYVKTSNGRPAVLLRTYRELGGGWNLNTGGHMEQDAELEGVTVRFEYDEDDESYELSWEGDEKSEDVYLQILAEDLDLRELLPREEVAEGQTWEVAWPRVGSLIWPGLGPHGMVGENGAFPEAPVEVLGILREAFEDEVVEVTYLGERDVDGTACHVLGLTSDASAAADLMELAAGESNFLGLPGDVSAFDADVSLDLSGELLWSKTAGRFHAFRFSGDAVLDLTFESTLTYGENEIPLEGEAEIGFELTHTASAR